MPTCPRRVQRFQAQAHLRLRLCRNFWRSREAFGDAITHERRGRCTAWCDAHPAADKRAAEIRLPVLRQCFPRFPNYGGVILADFPRNARPSSIVSKISPMPNQTDHRDQEIKSLYQRLQAKGQAQLARYVIPMPMVASARPMNTSRQLFSMPALCSCPRSCRRSAIAPRKILADQTATRTSRPTGQGT